MSMIPSWIRNLTILHAVIIAAVLVGIAVLFVGRGLLHTLLWLVALAAVVIGLVNYISYGPGGYRG